MRLLDNAVGRVCIALITAMALLITGVGFTSVANAADIPDFNPSSPSHNIGDGTTSTVTAEFYKDNKARRSTRQRISSSRVIRCTAR